MRGCGHILSGVWYVDTWPSKEFKNETMTYRWIQAMMPLIKLLEWDLSHSTCVIKWCSWARWSLLCYWFNNESFLVLAMKNIRCVVEFDDQQVVVKDHSHDLGRVLAKGVQEGGLYKLLAKTIKHRDLVHDTNNLYRLWHEIWSPTLWSITSFEGHGVGIVELQDE